MPVIMPAKIIKLLGTADDAPALGDAAQRLRDGEIVIIPTETVYGAAGLLTNSAAISRLKQIRGASDAPPTLHLPSAEHASRYVGDISELAKRMMNKLWPGPVGLIFEVDPKTRARVAAKLKISESDMYQGSTITLRCPDHPAARELLQSINAPVVAISAAGPLEQWREKVDLILDAGPTQYPRASTLIKLAPDQKTGYRIIRAGVYDERIIEKMLKTTILFVCSGNTCRSPMAEALARKFAADYLKVSAQELIDKGYVIGSAGVIAVTGTRATPPAIAAIEQLGGDLSKHRSRVLSPELIHHADAIFVMGQNHRRAALAMSPNAAAKVHLLDPAGDIEDPIGGDVALYLSLARRLNTLIADRFAALQLM